MQGTPQTMQIKPKYKHVLLDIYDFFEEKISNISNNASPGFSNACLMPIGMYVDSFSDSKKVLSPFVT